MKEKTPHILNASSNLLGFCFFILTAVKTLGVPEATFIDEIVTIAILLLAISVFLSFLSIRNIKEKSEKYELYADYTFLSAILFIVIIAALLFFSIV